MRIWNKGEILVGIFNLGARRVMPSIYELNFITEKIIKYAHKDDKKP